VDDDWSINEAKLKQVNGVMYMGGSEGNTLYYDYGEKVYDWVTAQNDAGTYYPIWGTCMGFQY
jgi:gamma-glutamyl hydrolase